MSQRQSLNYICRTCRRNFATSQRRYQENRPPTAPKQFPPISHIRQNVELYDTNNVRRKYLQYSNAAKRIAENAEKIANIDHRLRNPRQEIKRLQKQLQKQLHASSAERKNETIQELKRYKQEAENLESDQDQLTNENHRLALGMPNLTSPETPLNGEHKLLSYINYDPDNPPSFHPSADHSSIGERLGLIDFAAGSTTTGWGFYYLLNEAALLEQALIQYALSVTRRHGFHVIAPPSLVYAHVADSCGFQPRDQNDEQQIWQVAQMERDIGKPKRSLAATAEIPLAGLYAGKDIEEAKLPLKLVGSSRCYRAEAGARGVDTKGLYRVHEFTKVEMFAWTDSPSPSPQEDNSWTQFSTKTFAEMVGIQIEILTELGLPCRVLEMPSTDLGASAYRKIDIEALFPSRKNRDGGWGEVTSTSICTDYQSRRLDTRILEASGSRKKFPHTINGTAVAIPRVLAAILEHGWRPEEECVVIPEVLRQYMGGQDKIVRAR